MRKTFLTVIFAVSIMSIATACGESAYTEAPATLAEEIETPASTRGEITETAEAETEDEKINEAEEQLELKEFAERIKEAVEAKDVEAIAGLCAYPVYIETTIKNKDVYNNPDEVMELKPSDIFSDELLKAIASADVSSLDMVEAGVVMGDGRPGIIFDRLEDGGLGITGINQSEN